MIGISLNKSITIAVDQNDYPALFRTAEHASASTQTRHFRLIWIQSLLLTLGALLAMLSRQSPTFAIISAIVFLGSLGITVYSKTHQLQRSWYQARALAESIKTMSWRYMMAAEPFNGDHIASEGLFGERLLELLHDNQSLGEHFAHTSAADEQLTDRMRQIRQLLLDEKKSFYRKNRIVDQRQWYRRKALDLRKGGAFWFVLLIIVYILAVVCVLVRIRAPQFEFYPIGVLAVVASGILTWIQAKRYSEIAAAYTLTAHEIGILEQKLQAAKDDTELSNFVADAENAFSREHTQWVARRDE